MRREAASPSFVPCSAEKVKCKQTVTSESAALSNLSLHAHTRTYAQTHSCWRDNRRLQLLRVNSAPLPRCFAPVRLPALPHSSYLFTHKRGKSLRRQVHLKALSHHHLLHLDLVPLRRDWHNNNPQSEGDARRTGVNKGAAGRRCGKTPHSIKSNSKQKTNNNNKGKKRGKKKCETKRTAREKS